jgi:antibiotic biosynthesis monooxygenase (ABM) superfamily enzyme
MKEYLGATIQRPAAGSMEYTIIFRFDTVDNLRKFEGSELRTRHLDEVIDYVEADAIWKKFTGLEYWFTPPYLESNFQKISFTLLLSVIGLPFADIPSSFFLLYAAVSKSIISRHISGTRTLR